MANIVVFDDDDLILPIVEAYMAKEGHNVTSFLIVPDGKTIPNSTEPKVVGDNSGSITRKELHHSDLNKGKLFSWAIQQDVRKANIIISDYDIGGGKTGLDVVKKIQATRGCKRKPVVINTGSYEELINDDTLMRRAEKLGVTKDRFFPKGRHGSELVAFVTNILSSSDREVT